MTYRYQPSQWKTWCATCDREVQAGELVHFGGAGLKLHAQCHEENKGDDALRGMHFHEFPATWGGKCAVCSRPILKGQPIRWSSATVCGDCRPAPPAFNT